MENPMFTTFVLGPVPADDDTVVAIMSKQILDYDAPIMELGSQVAWDGEYGDPPVFAIGVRKEGEWEILTRAEYEARLANVKDEKMAPRYP